jgi:hypothetical protein
MDGSAISLSVVNAEGYTAVTSAVMYGAKGVL